MHRLVGWDVLNASPCTMWLELVNTEVDITRRKRRNETMYKKRTFRFRGSSNLMEVLCIGLGMEMLTHTQQNVCQQLRFEHLSKSKYRYITCSPLHASPLRVLTCDRIPTTQASLRYPVSPVGVMRILRPTHIDERFLTQAKPNSGHVDVMRIATHHHTEYRTWDSSRTTSLSR